MAIKFKQVFRETMNLSIICLFNKLVTVQNSFLNWNIKSFLCLPKELGNRHTCYVRRQHGHGMGVREFQNAQFSYRITSSVFANLGQAPDWTLQLGNVETS